MTLEPIGELSYNKYKLYNNIVNQASNIIATINLINKIVKIISIAVVRVTIVVT